MVSRRLLVCLSLVVMLAGCSSSEKTISEKATSEKAAPETAVPENVPSEKASPEAASAVPAAPQKHLFWKISDSNSVVYLMGSVHFADESFYPLDTGIVNAFDRSGELAVELDMTDTLVLKEIAVQTEKLGKLEAGRSLPQILPEDVMKSFDSLCVAWEFPAELLYGYKPWSAAMTLSSIAIMRLGFDPALGIDFFFLNRALEKQKKIISLEKVYDQVVVLAGVDVSDSLGRYYLKSTLRDIQLMDSSVVQMMQAWKTGDTAQFRAAMYMGEETNTAEDSLMLAEIEDRMYIERNKKMAESIAAFLAQDRNVFIVVGAGHMLGKGDNVLKLMRDRGFAVEQR